MVFHQVIRLGLQFRETLAKEQVRTDCCPKDSYENREIIAGPAMDVESPLLEINWAIVESLLP